MENNNINPNDDVIKDQEAKEDDKLPFTEHLEELRKRLIISFIAIGVGFLLCYGFKEKIFEILLWPLVSVMPKGDKVIFTSLPEAFFTYLKVAFLAGFFLAIPVIMYQLWMFIAPGLYRKEKRFILPAVFLSSLFFIVGSLFGYFVVFPFGFKFFLGFASEYIQAMPSMKEYLSFSITMLLVFGIIFELPLFITIMARLGLVTVELLRRIRRYMVVVFFTVAAILTPPDVITQILMAIPLMGLYEISIIGAKLFGKKKNQED